MKAIKFSNSLKDAGITLWLAKEGEPTVVIRKGPDGPEEPVTAVKVRRGTIILEH